MRGMQNPIRTKKIGKFAGSQEAVNRLIESNQRMKEVNCNQGESAEF